jgi:large subunit ribosomal protein L30
MDSINKCKVTLIKSKIGRLESHKACLKGLGLNKIGQTVELAMTPEVSGMVSRVLYMLKVEEIS